MGRIPELVRDRQVKVTENGCDELADEGIFARDVVESINQAVEIEDYPGYPKGPCVLVLQHDREGLPVHVVWGIPRGETEPAVLVTAYRPDRARWYDSFTQRKK